MDISFPRNSYFEGTRCVSYTLTRHHWLGTWIGCGLRISFPQITISRERDSISFPLNSISFPRNSNSRERDKKKPPMSSPGLLKITSSLHHNKLEMSASSARASAQTLAPHLQQRDSDLLTRS